ncbi:hypothetical protein HU200_035271 [Digitaria exilis]|uniref:Uncharacterized protein n=1 Tax=Digitaria exilis TaxID=1010633 RepID=A0A835AS27_9POAL|nr:hypothetical protein HU200_053287 [Digitaria exilis]KAF8697785.1 hypothetical protein HU200_035271 [Digitaria exilis]
MSALIVPFHECRHRARSLAIGCRWSSPSGSPTLPPGSSTRSPITSKGVVFLAATLPAQFLTHHVFLFYMFIMRWVIKVTGAAGTLYPGKTYQLLVDFAELPMETPQVVFLNVVLMHPHL